MKRVVLLIACLSLFGAVNAVCSTDSLQTLVRDLYTADPNTGAIIVVHQDASILELFNVSDPTQLREAKGYRVQIYSSNKGAKARQKAYEIKDAILKKEPTAAVYVEYNAPYWKTRIGNCQTEAQARELREWLITNFPEYQTEAYIVPSNILIK